MKLRLTEEGLIEGLRYVPSPNCDERPAGCAVELIVIHSISLPPGKFGGPGIEALFTNRLDTSSHPYYTTLGEVRVSAHFLIRRDGEPVQFVPCTKRAWHAGVSSWKGRPRCNDYSIGIEMEGTDHAPFADAQYEILVVLARALRARYPIEDVVGHSDVAPGRKTDPGPHFDWGRYRAMMESLSPRRMREEKESSAHARVKKSTARTVCQNRLGRAPLMEIRRASCGDYAEIIELQAANFLANLTAEDREGGFLSAQFTLPQIVAMADDLGVLVARDADHVVGYVCAHRPNLATLPPLVEAMVHCCRAASYRDTLLAHARIFVYGPVCIARAHRGRGVLRQLYRALLAEMAGEFEVGVTLVSDDNPHSLQAHIDGLGMDDVARFEHGGRQYHLLAFAVR